MTFKISFLLQHLMKSRTLKDLVLCDPFIYRGVGFFISLHSKGQLWTEGRLC